MKKMHKHSIKLLILYILISTTTFAQSDSIVLKDITWDKSSPAGSTELFIPSEGSKLAGVIYTANGPKKHPTLLLLHGYPGNERNIDIAQIVRARGWNVIYFDYRGSWGSEGKFSFKNCVQDVVNVVAFCKKNQNSLKIDTSNIVLFGHSMGGWICLKALQQLPTVKKGFALSSWNIGEDFKNILNKAELLKRVNNPNIETKYFVLNSSPEEIFSPVIQDRLYYNLINDTKALSNKQIIMLDEHHKNQPLADKIRVTNKAYFNYDVWPTDHPFSNKRISMINTLLTFLDQK